MDLTPKEFSKVVRSFYLSINERNREEWERVRWLGWTMYCNNAYLKNKPASPKSLMKFPWEEDEDNLDPEFIDYAKTLDWDSIIPVIPPDSSQNI
jgi:hypothetical protein